LHKLTNTINPQHCCPSQHSDI